MTWIYSYFWICQAMHLAWALRLHKHCLSLPGTPPLPAMAQELMSAPWGQQRCSRVSLQLPTVPIEQGPPTGTCPSLSLSPRRCRIPRAALMIPSCTVLVWDLNWPWLPSPAPNLTEHPYQPWGVLTNSINMERNLPYFTNLTASL